MIRRKVILLIIYFCMINSLAIAGSEIIDKQLSEIYKKAETAITKSEIEKSDFWMARYMGLSFRDEKTKRQYTDLYPLFEKRKDLVNTAFISGHYSKEFIDFFITGTFDFWGIPDEGVDQAELEFSVRGGSNDKYFAEVIVSPRLENWSIIGNGVHSAVIPLVSFAKRPFIYSGELKDKKPVKYFKKMYINTDEHFLQYIWPVEFHDLDGDGIPEIWLRFNAAWADGFSQILDIYKIKKDKLVLFKRFEGQAEGIARRLTNGTVEVGTGFTDKAVGHMLFDQHHIESFVFNNSKFNKVSEKNVPHLLWGNVWKDYYFEQ